MICMHTALLSYRVGQTDNGTQGLNCRIEYCALSTIAQVSGSFDGTVRIWDTRQGKCVRSLSEHVDPVTSVDMNHDDSLICSTSLDGLLRLWDARVGNCISILQEDQFPARPLGFGKFTPNGKFVLMMTIDGTLMLIDVDTTEVCVSSGQLL